MRKYLNVYKLFMSTNLAVEMSFRVSFFLVFMVEATWLIVLLCNSFLIYENLEGGLLNNWTLNHFCFFSVLVALYDQLFLCFFAKNFWMFSETLRTGTMDFILTKPVSSLFSVFMRYQRIASLFSCLLTLACMFYFGIQLQNEGHVNFTVTNVSFYVILIVLGLILRAGLEIIVGTFMFVTVEGEAVNIFRLNLQQFAKYPAFIYTGIMKTLLYFVFPLCMVSTLPVEWLFSGQADPSWLYALSLLCGSIVVVWSLVALIWKWGLNRYESASS